MAMKNSAVDTSDMNHKRTASPVDTANVVNELKNSILTAGSQGQSSATGGGSVNDTTPDADSARLADEGSNDVAPDDRAASEESIAQDAVELSNVYNAVWLQKPGLENRVRRLVSSSDNEDGRYNIFNIPREQAEWMTIGPQQNKQVLMLEDDPVRFWIVGVVARDGAHLAASDGTNNRQVSVCVHPVRVKEHDRWTSFLQQLGGVQLPYSPINGTLSARRRMVFRQGGHGIVAPFNNCFDARRTLRPYRVMDKWSPQNIDENDLIVMEVRIDRWKCDSVGNVQRYGTWNNYRVGLELLAVSLLLKGSIDVVQGPSAILEEYDYNF